VQLRGHCNRVMLREMCATDGALLQDDVRKMCAAERALPQA